MGPLRAQFFKAEGSDDAGCVEVAFQRARPACVTARATAPIRCPGSPLTSGGASPGGAGNGESGLPGVTRAPGLALACSAGMVIAMSAGRRGVADPLYGRRGHLGQRLAGRPVPGRVRPGRGGPGRGMAGPVRLVPPRDDAIGFPGRGEAGACYRAAPAGAQRTCPAGSHNPHPHRTRFRSVRSVRAAERDRSPRNQERLTR